MPTPETVNLAEDSNTDSLEMVNLLISLGVSHNIAKTLLCLHKHGPSKSIELQRWCGLRQPDVSIAINRLKALGVVNIVPLNNKGRGRPSHVYELAMPLNEAMAPFRKQATERLTVIQNQLSRLSELANIYSN